MDQYFTERRSSHVSDLARRWRGYAADLFGTRRFLYVSQYIPCRPHHSHQRVEEHRLLCGKKDFLSVYLSAFYADLYSHYSGRFGMQAGMGTDHP